MSPEKSPETLTAENARLRTDRPAAVASQFTLAEQNAAWFARGDY